jgi:hypothetical protein
VDEVVSESLIEVRPQLLNQRVVPVIEANAGDGVGTGSDLDELSRLVRVERQWFLGEEMLACLEASLIDLRMEVIRRAVVDGVDGVVFDHKTVVGIGPGHLEAIRRPGRAVLGAARDCGDHYSGDAAQRVHMGRGRKAAADYPYLHVPHAPRPWRRTHYPFLGRAAPTLSFDANRQRWEQIPLGQPITHEYDALVVQLDQTIPAMPARDVAAAVGFCRDLDFEVQHDNGDFAIGNRPSDLDSAVITLVRK